MGCCILQIGALQVPVELESVPKQATGWALASSNPVMPLGIRHILCVALLRALLGRIA